MNSILKQVMTSRSFVNFMGSHLSTEEQAAEALGSLGKLMGNTPASAADISTALGKFRHRSNRKIRAKPGRFGSKAPSFPDFRERTL